MHWKHLPRARAGSFCWWRAAASTGSSTRNAGPLPARPAPAQAYGAGQYHLLGMVLQCAQALCLAIAAPAAAAWATGAMGPLLAWLGQPPDVAAATGRLLQLTWPVLLLLSVSETTAQCEPRAWGPCAGPLHLAHGIVLVAGSSKAQAMGRLP